MILGFAAVDAQTIEAAAEQLCAAVERRSQRDLASAAAAGEHQ